MPSRRALRNFRNTSNFIHKVCFRLSKYSYWQPYVTCRVPSDLPLLNSPAKFDQFIRTRVRQTTKPDKWPRSKHCIRNIPTHKLIEWYGITSTWLYSTELWLVSTIRDFDWVARSCTVQEPLRARSARLEARQSQISRRGGRPTGPAGNDLFGRIRNYSDFELFA